MSGVTRMGRERSRFRLSAAYMARVSTLRHYVHGDQHETDGGTFYCAACDLFASAGHFKTGHALRIDECHGDAFFQDGGHMTRYSRSLRYFHACIRNGDFIPGVYRPNDAPNCVIDPASFAGETNPTT